MFVNFEAIFNRFFYEALIAALPSLWRHGSYVNTMKMAKIYVENADDTSFFSVFFVVACFTCTPDSIELVNSGTWHRC